MKYLLILLLFFTYIATAFCQTAPDQYYIEIEDGSSIEMLKLPIHIDTVVDVRGIPDTPFGIGFKGLASKPLELFIKDDISKAFSKVFDASIQQRAEKKSILRITFLSINEYVYNNNTTQRREIAMEAEIAVPTNDGYKIYGPRRITESSSALDVTKSHGKALVAVLDRMISELVAFELNAEVPAFVSKEDIFVSNSQHLIGEKGFSTIEDGVFSTFMDFRAGDSKPLFKVEFKKAVVVHTDLDGSMFSIIKLTPAGLLDRKAFNQIWGVQFQGKPYMKIGNNFHEVKRTLDGQIVSAVPEQIFRRTGSQGMVVMSGLLFGAIGAGLATLASSVEKNSLEVSEIHLATGQIGYHNLPKEQLDELSKNIDIAILSSAFNKKNRPITLTLEDGRNFLLYPGEHVILPLETDICLSSVKDVFPECSTLTTPRGRDKTLYRIKEQGRGNFRIETLNTKSASDFFSQVDNGFRREAKIME